MQARGGQPRIRTRRLGKPATQARRRGCNYDESPAERERERERQREREKERERERGGGEGEGGHVSRTGQIFSAQINICVVHTYASNSPAEEKAKRQWMDARLRTLLRRAALSSTGAVRVAAADHPASFLRDSRGTEKRRPDVVHGVCGSRWPEPSNLPGPGPKHW